MNIPLNVLIAAVDAMRMLRDVADDKMDTAQFMQAMRAHSELSAYVDLVTNQIKIEVEAA